MLQQESRSSMYDSLLALVLAVAILVAVIGAIVVIRGSEAADRLKLATGYALLIFLFFLSLVILLEIIRNKIDLSQMLEELSSGASMSRFQLLVFTFVIAFSLFFITIKKNDFPVVPANVLALLGVSASTYAVSKGLQVASGDTGASSGGDSEAKKVEPKP